VRWTSLVMFACFCHLDRWWESVNPFVLLHSISVLVDGSCPVVSIQSFSSGVVRIVTDFYTIRSRTNHVFPLSSSYPKSRQEVRDFCTWNTQMVKLLRQLISGLSDTVGAWAEFQRKETGYFLYDGDSPITSSSLKPSVDAVDKAFSGLNGLLRKLQDLRIELCEDNPQGVCHLSYPKFEG